jgi:hypothetical protein
VIDRARVVILASSQNPTFDAQAVPYTAIMKYAIGQPDMSSSEFRENAEECRGWAKSARSDRERQIFLQMAEAWRAAALRSEIMEQSVQSAATELVPSLSSLGAREDDVIVEEIADDAPPVLE